MKKCLLFACILINNFLIGQTDSSTETSFIITPQPKTDRPLWWADRHKEKVKEAKNRANEIDIVMIGDSITHNLEKKEDQAKIWKEYFPNYEFLNLGFGADFTENVLWRLQNGEIKGINPKLAILMIGTNNGNRLDSAEEIAQGTKLIIGEILTQLPNTQVLVLSIFSRGLNEKNRFRKVNEQVNQIVPIIAKHPRVHYLNINSAFVDEDGNLYKDELMPDSLHPNTTGVQAWAQSIKPTVEELINLP